MRRGTRSPYRSAVVGVWRATDVFLSQLAFYGCEHDYSGRMLQTGVDWIPPVRHLMPRAEPLTATRYSGPVWRAISQPRFADVWGQRWVDAEVSPQWSVRNLGRCPHPRSRRHENKLSDYRSVLFTLVLLELLNRPSTLERPMN